MLRIVSNAEDVYEGFSLSPSEGLEILHSSEKSN